ncbi:MAG: twin-arginine translocase TatA/TatE family subunit [Bacteroidales bacterium]|nr:twin-arginine translocase TatA/TatE family subunit [Bacteroidales bacterium]MCF8404788.1 twin-arginine translocase TatA/TatE family subunit [Bacteroidales bacterium]
MTNFLLFFNISGGEILVILLVVYLVFGPKKIPELARMLGKGINELRRATNEIKREITKETSGVKRNLDLGIDLNDPLDLKKNPAPKTSEKKSNTEHTDPYPQPPPSAKEDNTEETLK